MIAGDGNIDFIEQQHKIDEEFHEAIFENTMMQLEEDSPLKQLDISSEENDKFKERVLWVLERLIEFGGPDFLWEKNYRPSPTEKSIEELDAYSSEEMEAHRKERLFYMTNAAKDEYMLSMYFLQFAGDYSNEQMKEDSIQQKILTAYINGLKEKVFTDNWDQEKEEYCLELGKKNLMNIISMEEE